jgi:hypothetical protein
MEWSKVVTLFVPVTVSMWPSGESPRASNATCEALAGRLGDLTEGKKYSNGRREATARTDVAAGGDEASR